MSLNAVAEASVSGTLEPSSVPLSTSSSLQRHSEGEGDDIDRSTPRRRSLEGGADVDDDDDGEAPYQRRRNSTADPSQLTAEMAMSGNALSRSKSVKSNRSTTSFASSHASHYSTGGASSFSTSTTGTGSGQRRVLPCYNLEFHSLQPSFVTDASTDVKIAKIHKKGIEMLDFAYLDVRSPAPGGESRC